jgi:hypothetical protein
VRIQEARLEAEMRRIRRGIQRLDDNDRRSSTGVI